MNGEPVHLRHEARERFYFLLITNLTGYISFLSERYRYGPVSKFFCSLGEYTQGCKADYLTVLPKNFVVALLNPNHALSSCIFWLRVSKNILTALVKSKNLDKFLGTNNFQPDSFFFH